MPLENLEGDSVFINALVATNPAGTDYPFPDGDNHIRGIKKVLKNTFPNFDSQITRSSSDIQRGSVPAGAIMVFFMTAAPLGWVRTQGITTTYALRIVPTVSSGGTSGGADDPVLNNKVPSHTHSVGAVTTGTESADHVHTGNTLPESADHSHSGVTGTDSPEHAHLLAIQPWSLAAGSVPSYAQGLSTATSGATARHEHTFTTGGRSQAHFHNFTTGSRSATHTHTVPVHNTNANASSANWAPRYLNSIVCTKS